MTANQFTRFAYVFIGKERKSHVHIMLIHSLKKQPFLFVPKLSKVLWMLFFNRSVLGVKHYIHADPMIDQVTLHYIYACFVFNTWLSHFHQVLKGALGHQYAWIAQQKAVGAAYGCRVHFNESLDRPWLCVVHVGKLWSTKSSVKPLKPRLKYVFADWTAGLSKESVKKHMICFLTQAKYNTYCMYSFN